jgi:putative DNA primase/helicase
MRTASTRAERTLSAAEIAAALDGNPSGDGWVARCPAHDDRTPSLSISEHAGRILVRCFAGCSQTAVITALRERGLWRSAGSGRTVPRKRERNNSRERTDVALRIWRQAQPAVGTFVESYLRTRGIMLHVMPETLRHARLHHKDSGQILPAMVAAVQDVSGDIVAIHRTFLRSDGTAKAGTGRAKMMLGPTAGGAVRLTEAGECLAIAEGVETALSVHIATGLPAWAALSTSGIRSLKLPALPLASDVIIAADADDSGAGLAAAQCAATRWQAEGRRVRIALPPVGMDFNDVLREHGAARVCELFDSAQPVTAETEPSVSVDDTDDSISRLLTDAGLAALPDSPRAAAVESALRTLGGLLISADPLRRAVVRSAASELLKARKVNSPTSLVDAALGTVAPTDAKVGQGTALTLSDPEPWPDAVDGAALLDALARVFTRHVVLPIGAAAALALWVLQTYCLDAFEVAPILGITSPQKECGKTTLLSVLAGAVRRALPAANISPAAVYRTIEIADPTLLIDEADSFLRDNEQLRGTVNSGHTRPTGFVVRCVGDDYEPRRFNTFCMKAIAAIGDLPGTIESRAIGVRLKRRMAGEHVERLRADRLERELEPLRRQAVRWAKDNEGVLREADPPVDMINRSIADAVGGEWGRVLDVPLSH